MDALSSFDTLVNAKLYQATQTGAVTANLMNSLLAQAGAYVAMERIAQTDGHMAQNAMKAFFDVRSTEYNFIVGNSTGDAQIALLDTLIAAGNALDITIAGTVIKVADLLAALKPTLIGLCNAPYYPYADKTEHDFALAKGTIARAQMPNTEIDQGYLKIELNTSVAGFEAHRPRIYVKAHNGYKQKSVFDLVEVGDTEAVAFVNANTDLYVDNHYGAIINGVAG